MHASPLSALLFGNGHLVLGAGGASLDFPPDGSVVQHLAGLHSSFSRPHERQHAKLRDMSTSFLLELGPG